MHFTTLLHPALLALGSRLCNTSATQIFEGLPPFCTAAHCRRFYCPCIAAGLAQNRYFEDPAFLEYLRYLQYWQQPQYAQYIV